MKTNRAYGLAVLFVFLGSAAFAPPAAGGSLARIEGPRMNQSAAPLSSLLGTELNPDLAYGATNERFLLAYSNSYSYPTPPGETFVYSVKAQMVDLSGSPVNLPLDISSEDGSPRGNPAAAYNSILDEFLVLWDSKYDPNDSDIFGRRVSGVGAVIGETEIFVNFTNKNDSLPDLAYNPNTGEYLAVYQRYATDQSEIIIHRLNEYGSPYDLNGTTLGDVSIDESEPRVTCNTITGEYLVIWHQQTAAGNYDIYGQLVSSGGAPIDVQFPISTAPNDQLHPQIAFNPTNQQYLVVWRDERLDGDIYAQRLAGSGALIGGNFAVADLGTDIRTNPQVAYLEAADDFMVAWSLQVSNKDFNVFRRRVKADGGCQKPRSRSRRWRASRNTRQSAPAAS